MQAPEEHVDWSEERLRYKVLEQVYERAAGVCTRGIDYSEIGSALGLHYEELFRTLYLLERSDLLIRLPETSAYCITPAGLHYIEETAQRRRSVRSTAPR